MEKKSCSKCKKWASRCLCGAQAVLVDDSSLVPQLSKEESFAAMVSCLIRLEAMAQYAGSTAMEHEARTALNLARGL